CGDPLAPPDALDESIRDFVERCRRNGWTPAVYGVPDEHVALYENAGLKLLPIAQEALITLRDHGATTAGPKGLAVRLAEARAAGRRRGLARAAAGRKPHRPCRGGAGGGELRDHLRGPGGHARRGHEGETATGPVPRAPRHDLRLQRPVRSEGRVRPTVGIAPP